LIQQFPESGDISLERHLISEEFGDLEPMPIMTPTDVPD
jgi:hypothetical protein